MNMYNGEKCKIEAIETVTTKKNINFKACTETALLHPNHGSWFWSFQFQAELSSWPQKYRLRIYYQVSISISVAVQAGKYTANASDVSYHQNPADIQTSQRRAEEIIHRREWEQRIELWARLMVKPDRRGKGDNCTLELVKHKAI